MARFSNFGIGQNQDGTGAYTLDGNEITFARGIYRVGDQVMLTAGARTWTGRFVGFENRTGNAIFWVPASGGQQAFSLIATNEPGTGSHTVPDGGVITDVAYETDASYGTGAITFSEFGNYGTRQGDTDGPFALQGESLTVPDGIHRVGDEVTIHVSGRAISTTFVGFENTTTFGVRYPVFRDDDGLHYIATIDETGSSYTPVNTITSNQPYVLGDFPVTRYSNYGLQFPDSNGEYDPDNGLGLTGRYFDVLDRIYRSGDKAILHSDTGDIFDVTFVGYEAGTFYPIFENERHLLREDDPARYILTDETDTFVSYEPGEIVTDAPYKIGGESTFSNYGFRQGNNLVGDFTLQGDGRHDGLNIEDGVYGWGVIVKSGVWTGLHAAACSRFGDLTPSVKSTPRMTSAR